MTYDANTIRGHCGGAGDTGLGYSAENRHRCSSRPFKWNPELKNRLVALRVHHAVFDELEIIQPEIAGKIGGPKVAGGYKLIKASGILPTVVCRVIFDSREQGCHGVNSVRLSQYELVFRGHLIGGLRLCATCASSFRFSCRNLASSLVCCRSIPTSPRSRSNSSNRSFGSDAGFFAWAATLKGFHYRPSVGRFARGKIRFPRAALFAIDVESLDCRRACNNKGGRGRV